jgi:hypothetical protein
MRRDREAAAGSKPLQTNAANENQTGCRQQLELEDSGESEK